LHEIRWSAAGAPHPDAFGSRDLDLLGHSPASFARKFDASEEGLLDRLDLLIFGGERDDAPGPSDAP
ncbi:MAG TPA: hypothetical protein VL961_05490, partial [Acidimicrobiales bacterium]|nr:hypothetical protein [Acidimicrobiales bacterium]